MKIKVCGMRDPDNIEQLSNLPIDLIGLIFYPKSPRYVESLDPNMLQILPQNIERVGVFVNEDIGVVKQAVEKYNLHFVQLHGNESVDYCCELKSESNSIKIIKAFSIADTTDFELTGLYQDVVDYFLFDTKTILYGGSGQKFDWSVLKSYKGDISFLLSGGISSDDVLEIKKLNDSRIMALDLNSKFETKPGFKNIQLLDKFINEIKA